MPRRDEERAYYRLAFWSALCAVLLSLPASGAVKALREACAYLISPALYAGFETGLSVGGFPGRVKRLVEADEENRRLRDRLQRFEWLESQVSALGKENAALRSELGLHPPSGARVLWARVLEKDPTQWYHSILVAAGSSQGVLPNSPVLAPSEGRTALVGQVTRVERDVSEVLLITDELSAVTAYASSRSVSGLVLGQGGAALKMLYIPEEASELDGAPVYTSPASPSYPPHILIGMIKRLNPPDPFLGLRSAVVTPAVSPQALSDVLILMARKEAP